MTLKKITIGIIVLIIVSLGVWAGVRDIIRTSDERTKVREEKKSKDALEAITKDTTFVVKEKQIFNTVGFIQTNEGKIYYVPFWCDYMKLKNDKMFKAKMKPYYDATAPPAAQNCDGQIYRVELLR